MVDHEVSKITTASLAHDGSGGQQPADGRFYIAVVNLSGMFRDNAGLLELNEALFDFL